MLSSLQPPRTLSRFPSKPIYLFRKTSLKPLSSQPITNSTLTDQSQSQTHSQILSIRHSLLCGQLTATQLVESFLTRLRQTEPHLRSFLHVSDTVLRQANELDEKIKRNEEVGPLAGVLVGVKDNICTAGMPSTGGSRILEGYQPPFDATAVRKIKELGGIVVGKTNLDEFGMGSTTEGSAFQVTANPWDVSRVPGGSSGGSAAAVSARQCVVSLGSDTGGSVRQPASFCGVVGLKPTYGRVSRFGLMAYASSLDVIGCFGSSVEDAGILLQAISGHDRLDATSSKQEVPDFTSQFISLNLLESKPLKGLRIGLIRETLDDGVDSGVNSAIRGAASHLEELGCSVSEVSLPSFSLGLPAYYILASSESSSNLSRYDGVRYGNQVTADELNALYGDSRAKGFGHEVKMRILMGTYALSAGYYDAYYKRAQQVRTIIQKSFKAALDEHDILISPAAPSAAYKIVCL
nr:glutamyl-tRNA(Gln) amidotransferase subunit A, chloroplastic/mitochondrial isoform X2 [Ziziphus jujuba var. spinosa]